MFEIQIRIGMSMTLAYVLCHLSAYAPVFQSMYRGWELEGFSERSVERQAQMQGSKGETIS
jgi:hypothetical protein